MRSTEKKYYKIKEVSEMLGIPIATLRFWEQRFTILSPRRSRGNDRMYTVADIEKIKMIWYLVKERGMKLAAAEAQIRHNRKNVSKRSEVAERLVEIRTDLQSLSDALDEIWRRSRGGGAAPADISQ